MKADELQLPLSPSSESSQLWAAPHSEASTTTISMMNNMGNEKEEEDTRSVKSGRINSLSDQIKTMSRSLSFHSRNLSTVPYPKSSGVDKIMINVVMHTKTLPTVDDILKFIEDKMLKFLRFRAVPTSTWWGSYWKEVQVIPANHVFVHTVEDNKAAHAALENIIQLGYERDLPRWDIRLVKNKQTESLEKYPDAKNMAIVRVDHCISDGVSLVKTCVNFFTDKNGKGLEERQEVGLIRSSGHQNTPVPIWKKSEDGKSGSNNLRNNGRYQNLLLAAYFLFGWLVCVKNFLLVLMRLIYSIYCCHYEMNGPYDSDSGLILPKAKRIKSGVRHPTNLKVVKGRAVSLEFVKKLKNKLGVSVNDVLITAFSGAVRSYCDKTRSLYGESNEKNSKLLIRALVPYAFVEKPSVYKDEVNALRNRWASMSVTLDVAEKDPIKRLQNMYNEIRSLRNRFQPLTNYYVQKVLGSILPASVVKQRGADLYNRHSVIFTAVPSLTVEPFCFVGSLIEEIYVYLDSVIPIVEIISYNNKMFFSLVGDADVMTDMHLLPEYFIQELHKIGNSVGISEVSKQKLLDDSMNKKKI